jgi:co-chaperonin GroES (HSP10)
MSFRARGKTVFFRVSPPNGLRASGLFVPFSSDERPQEGTIVSLGPLVSHSALREGVKIFFGRFSVDRLFQDIYSLRESDVLGVALGERVIPISRLLVEMLPAKDDFLNSHHLSLVDQKKHFEHDFRRGRVLEIDPEILTEIQTGDVVIFHAARGFTLDGDILDEDDRYDAPMKGESMRWLKPKEIDAIDDQWTERLAREGPKKEDSPLWEPVLG